MNQLAVASSLSAGFYLLFVVITIVAWFAKAPGCSWYVDQSIRGADNRTYYILHANPPLNGPGHAALARRTGGNRFYYTMKLLSDFNWSYHKPKGKALLITGTEGPNPEVRKICRMLLKSPEVY